jgi:hypothetical protein
MIYSYLNNQSHEYWLAEDGSLEDCSRLGDDNTESSLIVIPSGTRVEELGGFEDGVWHIVDVYMHACMHEWMNEENQDFKSSQKSKWQVKSKIICTVINSMFYKMVEIYFWQK